MEQSNASKCLHEGCNKELNDLVSCNHCQNAVCSEHLLSHLVDQRQISAVGRVSNFNISEAVNDKRILLKNARRRYAVSLHHSMDKWIRQCQAKGRRKIPSAEHLENGRNLTLQAKVFLDDKEPRISTLISPKINKTSKDGTNDTKLASEAEGNDDDRSARNARYWQVEEKFNEYWTRIPENPTKRVRVPSRVIAIFTMPKKPRRMIAVCRHGQILVMNTNELKRDCLVNVKLPSTLKRKILKIACSVLDTSGEKLLFSLDTVFDGIFTCSLAELLSPSEFSAETAVELKTFVKTAMDVRAFCGMEIDQEMGVLYSCDPFCKFNIAAWSLQEGHPIVEGTIKKPPSVANFQPTHCALSRPVERHATHRRRLMAVSDRYGYGCIYLFALGSEVGDYSLVGKIAHSHYPSSPDNMDALYSPSTLTFDMFSNLLVSCKGNRRVQILPQLQEHSSGKVVTPIWRSENFEAFPTCMLVTEPFAPDEQDEANDEEEDLPDYHNAPMVLAIGLRDNSIISFIAKR